MSFSFSDMLARRLLASKHGCTVQIPENVNNVNNLTTVQKHGCTVQIPENVNNVNNLTTVQILF